KHLKLTLDTKNILYLKKFDIKTYIKRLVSLTVSCVIDPQFSLAQCCALEILTITNDCDIQNILQIIEILKNSSKLSTLVICKNSVNEKTLM
ncbi:unnamed protein product, partial [Didymodactylos carnosus]